MKKVVAPATEGARGTDVAVHDESASAKANFISIYGCAPGEGVPVESHFKESLTSVLDKYIEEHGALIFNDAIANLSKTYNNAELRINAKDKIWMNVQKDWFQEAIKEDF